MKTTLELRNNESAKFWTIESNGCTHTVTYGKLGAKGQSRTKTFASEAECEASAKALIEEKLAKGYRPAKDAAAEAKRDTAIIDAFIDEHLTRSDVSERVQALVRALNVPVSEPVQRFLSALEESEGIELDEWRLGADELPDHRPGGKNLVEQMILADQADYLGTRLVELFTNSIHFGALGNGDSYLLNFAGSDTNLRQAGQENVVYFNHETFDPELTFADSLATHLALTTLFTRANADELEEDELREAMARLADKATLPWHYNALVEDADAPAYEGDRSCTHLHARALWLIYLLRQDGVTQLDAMPELFALVDREIGKPDEFFARFDATSPSSAGYWLWYCFFFDKQEALQALMRQFAEHPSPLVQDTRSLIGQFLAGRKELGKIEDIHALKAGFLALDLDPEREAERQQERQRAEAEAKAREATAVQRAQDLIARHALADLPRIAWEHLEEPRLVEALYDHLRQHDTSLARDFARYDYLEQNKASRDNRYYDFELKEVREALCLDSPRLAPLLCVKGFAVIAPELAALAKRELQKPGATLTARWRAVLAHNSVPELEPLVLASLPRPIVKDDVIGNDRAMDALAALCPILACMRSQRCLAPLQAWVEGLRKLAGSRAPDTAARARMYLNERVGPLVLETLAATGNRDAVPFIRGFLSTELANQAERALVEIGDPGIVAELARASGGLLGAPEKTASRQVLLAYAQSRAGMQPALEACTQALDVLPHKDGDRHLHRRALAVLARHGAPDEVRDLMRPFLDHPDAGVRGTVLAALRRFGEDVQLTYMDPGHATWLLATQGRDALAAHLTAPGVVFRYEVLRVLAEAKAGEGLEDRIIAAGRILTRFTYYTNSYESGGGHDAKYGIYALALFKLPRVDGFVHSLMGHPNVAYRQNDLFRYKNYEHSDHLAALMKSPPPVRTAAAAPARTLAQTSLGGATWLLGVDVHGISYQPHGDTVAVAGGGRTAIFAADGTVRHELDKGGWAYDCHHNPQGTLVAVGFHGGALRIYDAVTGERKGELEGHGGVPDGVRKVKFSPDGRLLASASSDCTVRVWDVAAQRELHCFTFKSDANTVDWFPDQERLVVGTDKGVELVRIGAAPNAKRTSRKVGASAEVQVVDMGGELQIFTDGGAAIHRFDAKLDELETFAQEDVCRIRITPDRKRLLAASWQSGDAGLSCWDLATRKRHVLDECTGIAAFGLDLNPHTGEVAVGGKNRSLVRFADGQRHLPSAGAGHTQEVNGIAAAPNGLLFTVGKDVTVIAWDGAGQGRTVFADPQLSLAESLAFAGDGTSLLIGSSDRITVMELAEQRLIAIDVKGRVRSFAWLDAQHTFATVGRHVYALQSGKTSEDVDDMLHGLVALRRRRRLVAYPFLEKDVHVFNGETLALEHHFRAPIAGTHGIYDMALDHAERRLYISGADDVVRAHDVDTWEVVAELHLRDAADRVAVSPDDALLAVGIGQTIEVYRLADRQLHARGAMNSPISALAFTDARTIVAGGKGGEVVRAQMDAT